MRSGLTDGEGLVLSFVEQLEAFCNEMRARRYVHAHKVVVEELIGAGQRILAHGDCLKRLEDDELVRLWLEDAIERRECALNVVTHFLAFLAGLSARSQNA